jgi:hypothetical protein
MPSEPRASEPIDIQAALETARAVERQQRDEDQLSQLDQVDRIGHALQTRAVKPQDQQQRDSG